MRLWLGVALGALLTLAACGGKLADTTQDEPDDRATRDFGTKKQHYRDDDDASTTSSGRRFAPKYCGGVSCELVADGWYCNTVATQNEMTCSFNSGVPTAVCQCNGAFDAGVVTFEVDATGTPDEARLEAAWAARCGRRCIVDAGADLDAGF